MDHNLIQSTGAYHQANNQIARVHSIHGAIAFGFDSENDCVCWRVSDGAYWLTGEWEPESEHALHQSAQPEGISLTAARRRGYHNEIMNIQTPQEIEQNPDDLRLAYKEGHRDARHHAADIAIHAERVIEALVLTLEQYREITDQLLSAMRLAGWDNDTIAEQARALQATDPLIEIDG